MISLNFRRSLSVLLVLSLMASCKLFRKSDAVPTPEPLSEAPIEADSSFMQMIMEALQQNQQGQGSTRNRLEETYQASATRSNDLLHTALEVSFDIPNQKLFGKANLQFRPYFHPVDSLILDAKAFDIQSVMLVRKEGQTALKYRYDERQLRIALDRTYTRNETYSIFIEYIANPSRVKAESSSAITDARGLYFIDPKGEDPSKPTQVWTQGETESSSCWFPTIDKPNEKTTQEIRITVPEKYQTLSNGLKTASKKNADGTRTDTWKMDQPHAPYLFMMAIGEYSVTKDKWKNIDVDYYVEPEFAPYARKIFGNTPEMLSFFSDRLGVVYPWPKYSQVVVRDYVSGAMENTSATIFGEFVQQTPGEMLDQNYEDVIAHELFHHWFGDLVTCESWANLPLNESFATYGEYLWEEHKYGREAADYHLYNAQQEYFSEASGKKVNLIRYDYTFREDMFDRHSYQKGGCVLHMLRKYLGDDAFFEGLKTYLNERKYKTAEIHDLRMAFEQVSGEDLNWFFNQWFLDKGHPSLTARWEYSDGAVNLVLEQTQDLTENSAFRLPLDVDIYLRGTVKRQRIVMDSIRQHIRIPFAEKPDFVNLDGEQMLLGVLDQIRNREDAEWLVQHGTHFQDRLRGLEYLTSDPSAPGLGEIYRKAMRDSHWYLRNLALESLQPVLEAEPEAFKNDLIRMAGDRDARVRASATALLDRWASEEAVKSLLSKALNDSSSKVQSAALGALYSADPKGTVAILETMEATAKGDMIPSIAAIYANAGTPGKYPFLEKAYPKLSNPNDQYIFIQLMGRYALSQDAKILEQSLPGMEDKAKNSGAWFLRLSAIQVLAEYLNYYESGVDELSAEINGMIEKGASVTSVQDKEIEKTALKAKKTKIEVILESIRETEKDPNLSRILNMREP